MAELPPYFAAIEPSWIDYNGHVRDAYYGLIASYAVDAVMDHLGLDAAYRARTHCTLYTLELHFNYFAEVKGSDELSVHSSILDFDHKRLQIGCRLVCPRIDKAVATAEMLLLHVHQGEQPAAASFPGEVSEKLEAFKATGAQRGAFIASSRKIALKRL